MNGSTITNHQRVRRIETYPVCTVDPRSLNLNSNMKMHIWACLKMFRYGTCKAV